MEKVQVGDKTFEIFINKDTIAKRVEDLATQLSNDYQGKKPIFLGVLNGSFLFLADLIKAIQTDCEIAFTKVASYKGTQSTGQITEQLPLPNYLNGRDVIVVEDIIDTGKTLTYLLEKIHAQKPASVAVCSLLFKPEAVKHPFKETKYIGFEIPNQFVVGYGLDYDGLGRNLCEIYKLFN